jgi:membrane protease YdiL (CAAX protease family)
MLLTTIQFAAVVAGLVACVLVWAWIADRVQHGRPMFRYWPRRPVPWLAWDVLLIVVFYLVAIDLARLAINHSLPPELLKPLPAGGDADAAHPIAKVILEGHLWVILFAGLIGALVAPIVEEFLFRVLLQGWLEAAEHRCRRCWRAHGRKVPRTAAPILLSSLLFAAIHFRRGGADYQLPYLIATLAGQTAATLAAVAFAVALLRLRAGATAADLGWSPRHFWADVRLGLLAFVAVGPPIYILQIGLSTLLTHFQLNVAADPIPIFFFALAVGTLYYRTHRIVPSVVLHMSLNFTSLAMALLSLPGH